MIPEIEKLRKSARVTRIAVDLPSGGKVTNASGQALDRRSALICLNRSGGTGYVSESWMVVISPLEAGRIDGPGRYLGFSTSDFAMAALECWVAAGMPGGVWYETVERPSSFGE